MKNIMYIMEKIKDKYGRKANLNISADMYCNIYLGDFELGETEYIEFEGSFDELIITLDL